MVSERVRERATGKTKRGVVLSGLRKLGRGCIGLRSGNLLFFSTRKIECRDCSDLWGTEEGGVGEDALCAIELSWCRGFELSEEGRTVTESSVSEGVVESDSGRGKVESVVVVVRVTTGRMTKRSVEGVGMEVEGV